MMVAVLVGVAAPAAQVNVIETSVNDADGSTIGAVSTNRFVEIGTNYTTAEAPVAWSSYRFTHWSNTSPAALFRDAWGRSQNPVAFVVGVACTATAHYLPSARDSDGDGVPDWYEVEHFGDLGRGAGDDGDGDGIALSAEYGGGTSPLYANSRLEGGVAWADSGPVMCNFAGYPIYVLRSDPAGTVDESGAAQPGTVVTVPDLAGNASFGYWELDGVRQQDAWGRALSVFGFAMASSNREAVAYLFAGDGDGDGVPDAFEQRYYGSLSYDGASDTDGDGITLSAEYGGGTSPIHANGRLEGGVAWADSGLVTCNFAGYPTYVLRSVPPGTVDQSGVVPPGTVVSVPDLSGNASFGYWELDGVRQQDAWGRALSGFGFTMASSNREAVAYLFAGDGDGDGVPDAFEQRYYGSLSYDGGSDTDGDGITLLAECGGGTSPIYANGRLEGGVSWADSAIITCNLQAEIVVDAPLVFNIADGGTNDLGMAAVGSPQSVTFAIRNVGGRPLTGLAIGKDGADAAAFNVVSVPVAPVTHNGQTTLAIQFAPASGGPKIAAIHIASNDADENPFDITITGTGVVGLAGYELWAASHGLAGPDANCVAMPRGEGVANLLKYAFNMNGSAADSRVLMAGTGTSGLPCLRFEIDGASGVFRFEFLRRAGSGLVYTPGTSSTLLGDSWHPLADEPTIIPISAGWERVIYEERFDLALTPRLFGRVEVVLP